MKRLWVLFVMFFITIFAYSQDITGEEVKEVGTVLLENWSIVLVAFLAFVKVIISLTPSIKDDKLFGYIDSFFNIFIPNRTKK